ncbi:MAG TPA: hypothetical protein VK116_01935, partial [Planctomycetota bacterium]|nr:hypothetical protein [Planctomycetota bacterium]
MDYTPKHAYLELGSTSIKFYVEGPDGVENQVKIPWDLGFDVFEHGRISPRSLAHLLSTMRALESEHPDIPFSTVTA